MLISIEDLDIWHSILMAENKWRVFCLPLSLQSTSLISWGNQAVDRFGGVEARVSASLSRKAQKVFPLSRCSQTSKLQDILATFHVVAWYCGGIPGFAA